MVEVVDFLLTFFLGTFGIYRFYKGYKKTGILWLFTLGLLGIGWLVDLIYVIQDKELMWPN